MVKLVCYIGSFKFIDETTTLRFAHCMLLLCLTGRQPHFQADDGQFISQARIEAVNRRCDSYNKMLIVSILIFNAIIIAFITFLFFFPLQKYEL